MPRWLHRLGNKDAASFAQSIERKRHLRPPGKGLSLGRWVCFRNHCGCLKEPMVRRRGMRGPGFRPWQCLSLETTICSLGYVQGGGKAQLFLFFLVGGQASEDLENPCSGERGGRKWRARTHLGCPTCQQTTNTRVFKSELAQPLTRSRLGFLPRERCGLLVSNSAVGEEAAGRSQKSCGLASGPTLLRPAASSEAWRATRHDIHARHSPTKSLAPAPTRGPKNTTPQTAFPPENCGP